MIVKDIIYSVRSEYDKLDTFSLAMKRIEEEIQLDCEEKSYDVMNYLSNLRNIQNAIKNYINGTLKNTKYVIDIIGFTKDGKRFGI